MNLIKILTAESQSNDKVYFIIQNLFLILKEKDWLKKFIFWELELLKILGYDLALENLVEKDLEGNKTVYYASSYNEKKYVPNFLIEKDIEVNDLGTLLSGLKLVGDYLDKTILRPNNLIDFRKISNITSSNKDLIAQSTKMDFDENTYKNELWKYSKNTWKKFKGSKTSNFSIPKYSNNKKLISIGQIEINRV